MPQRRYLFLGLLCLVAVETRAQLTPSAPESISFQGFVTNGGGAPINDVVNITTTFYKNGVAGYTQVHPSVPIVNGIFDIVISPVDTVVFDQPIDLGIKLGADPEIAPRTPLQSAPFALGLRGFHAEVADDGFWEGYNVIGGAGNNVIADGVVGGTISGGGGWSGSAGTGLIPNSVLDDFGTVGGGRLNVAGNTIATVAGGTSNQALGSGSAIGGGNVNIANGHFSVIGGGTDNQTAGTNSTVGGGQLNFATANRATVPGGFRNRAAGVSSLAAGNNAKSNHDGTFVWSDRSLTGVGDSLASTGANQFLIRAAGGVGIGTNSPSSQLSVAGSANFTGSVGIGTTAPTAKLTVRGIDNATTGPMISFFGTSSDQVESGRIRFIEGGTSNFRGGYAHYDGSANRLHIGVHNTNSIDAANDENVITIPRDNGRIGIKNNSPGHPLVVGTNATNGNGAHVTAAGGWTNGSSRTFKANFEEIDKVGVLERLAALPVTRWRYRGEDESEHIGPTAEDFREAFGLGHDERYITTVDADGVALAAIQGLYELLLIQQQRIADLEARLAR